MRSGAVGLIVLSFARGALSAAPTPVDVRKLPAAAFKSLPENALVEVNGRQLTKAQFLAEMRALRGRMSALKAPSGPKPVPSDFSATRAKLLDQEQSRIAAKNARAAPGPGGPSPAATPDSCAQPKITAMSGAPPLEPGEQVILNGCGFGASDPGNELRLVGNFPGGFLKLQILKWYGNAIQAVVKPASGIDDQPAKLQVVRKDLLFSNEWPISFYATRDVTKLSQSEVKYTFGTDGNFFHGCDPNPYTICGSHWDNKGADHAVHSGTDTATANLKHHCVLAGIGWGWEGENGTLTADPTASLVNGSAAISMTFPWVLWAGDSPNRSVHYVVDLWALGPKGVPCH